MSAYGQLGVVSGTALDTIFVRRLQDGDPDGQMRRGLDRFPVPELAERLWEAFYIPGGKGERTPYKALPTHAKDTPALLAELCVVANFVEVTLARQGHDYPVGINYLEKVQLPHLPSIYGAMLAGVSYILMGAGVPLRIPGVLDRFARHEPATYLLQVTGAHEDDDRTMVFHPQQFMVQRLPDLFRPKFIPIISSNTLATTRLKKADGKVDGFVIESHTAGGHNAPPRGKPQLDARGELIYCERDSVDLERIRAVGLPFWLAGGYGSPEKLTAALNAGAAGVQVGTAFAFSEESGISASYKETILAKVRSEAARVFTDPAASPTRFPFKVAEMEGSLAGSEVYAARPRICDLGYLREAFRTPAGSIDYRCPAEPVTIYLSKGGRAEDTVGKKCLCNALMANIGHPQTRNGKYTEPPLITSGNDLTGIARFLSPGSLTYTAAHVVEKLLAGGELGRDQ